MLDFEVQRFTRRCAACQRELKPGETFYSVLVAAGTEVVRRDFSQESWHGPPADAIAWWRSEVPDPQANRLHWAPNDVILHYFQQVHEDPARQDLTYILALLMIRRRIFKLEATERDAQMNEVLLVYCPRHETEYRVVAAVPSEARTHEIQQELAQLLYAKADHSTAG